MDSPVVFNVAPTLPNRIPSLSECYSDLLDRPLNKVYLDVQAQDFSCYSDDDIELEDESILVIDEGDSEVSSLPEDHNKVTATKKSSPAKKSGKRKAEEKLDSDRPVKLRRSLRLSGRILPGMFNEE